ncbi:MAG: HAD family hydrolase [Deltaproteobacteria bacterium RBG_16_48_10]|nr:MAG: HAD family hydrolase [Deltaproteobacteria bacterium RBG_16_48_10]
MIQKELIEKIYVAASMQRWMDHIRPVEFTELDKQAHKMMIVFVIAKYEEQFHGKGRLDWIKLIEGGFFEFLQRVVLTDIKPPIFNRIKSKHGNVLNRLILENLSKVLEGVEGLRARFETYLMDPGEASFEKKILKASHDLATYWEFRMIYELNQNIYGIDATKKRIENEVEVHYSLTGVQQIVLYKKSQGFIDLCGQLRFQQRWAQTQRIPKTSVLGHMLIVAILSYLLSLDITTCKARLYNNYFAALFHDLPEVLTRDIVSPVKRSIEGLEDTIKEIEQELLDESILPLLPKEWHPEMKYFYFHEDPFENKVLEKGTIKKGLSTDEINEKYDSEVYHPLDGNMIFLCDKLAAYLEAVLSINHGINSRVLTDAKNKIRNKYMQIAIGGIPLGHLFEYDYSV